MPQERLAELFGIVDGVDRLEVVDGRGREELETVERIEQCKRFADHTFHRDSGSLILSPHGARSF